MSPAPSPGNYLVVGEGFVGDPPLSGDPEARPCRRLYDPVSSRYRADVGRLEDLRELRHWCVPYVAGGVAPSDGPACRRAVGYGAVHETEFPAISYSED
jgi:hypothetical protein